MMKSNTNRNKTQRFRLLFVSTVLMTFCLNIKAQPVDEDDDDSYLRGMLKTSAIFQEKENAGDKAYLIYFHNPGQISSLNDVKIIEGIEDYELTVQFNLKDFYDTSGKESVPQQILSSSVCIAYHGRTYYIQEMRIMEDYNIHLVIRPFDNI